MSESINLIKTREKEELRRQRKVFFLRTISFIFVGFVGIVSIILFFLYSRTSVSAIKKDQAQVLQNITFQKEKFAKYNLLSERLKGINQVIKGRKNYTTTLNSLLSQIPTGASATALTINKDGVTLTVTSSSLLPINKFLNNTVDLSSKKSLIRELTIESLTIDTRSGTYSLSVKAKNI